MSRKQPLISDYMSRMPKEIDERQSVGQADALMRAEDIGHLAVMSGAKLVGVVSLHDTELVLASQRSAAKVLVGDICSRDLLTASPMDTVSSVAKRLIDRKVGSAPVVDADVIVGIFTTTDAMRALCDAYASRRKTG